MKYAPELPTTLQLGVMHPFGFVDGAHVRAKRTRINEVCRGNGFVAIIGGCALTNEHALVMAENAKLAKLEKAEGEAKQPTGPGIVVLQRENDWKPRSKGGDWHGLITTDPVQAHYTITQAAKQNANIAQELGYRSHIERNAARLSLGWVGSRADGDSELIVAAALIDPTLPLGIKNGMDGSIDNALAQINRVQELRHRAGGEAILIYRGGTCAQTPQTWEDGYKQAWERTGGKLILDTAHGGERAHAPNKDYDRTIEGQIACQEHTLLLADAGYAPAGVLIEASDTATLIDPNMPFDQGVTFAQDLYHIIARQRALA